MAAEQVTVAIDEGYRARFREVVDRARKVGLRVDQELSELGIVTGSIEADKIDDLARVEGIQSAERARTFQLAPPDSPVQ